MHLISLHESLRMPSLKTALIWLAVSSMLWSCGNETLEATNTPCTASLAQLAVFDTFLENLCGCQEAGSTVISPPNPLTCTITVGTTVVFYYTGTRLTHEIASTGTPKFEDSPVSVPSAKNPILSYSVTFTTAGDYFFEDMYNTALNGEIVVQ